MSKFIIWIVGLGIVTMFSCWLWFRAHDGKTVIPPVTATETTATSTADIESEEDIELEPVEETEEPVANQ